MSFKNEHIDINIDWKVIAVLIGVPMVISKVANLINDGKINDLSLKVKDNTLSITGQKALV